MRALNFAAVSVTDSATDTDAVGAGTVTEPGAATPEGVPAEGSDDLLIEVDGQLVPNSAATIKPIRRRNAVSELALIVMFTAPKSSGSLWTCSVSRVTTPRLLPPPPLRPQNSSGFVHAFAMRTAPSAVTTSASSRLPEASP